MFRKFLCAGLIAVTAILTGCASVPMASPEADAKAKSFKADPDKANLYIYRNETFGAAVKVPVLLDGTSVGDTASKTYIFRQVAPGAHVVTSKSENDATITVDAVAGKNYFVWQEIKMGLFSPRTQLQLMDATQGSAGVNECKLVQ